MKKQNPYAYLRTRAGMTQRAFAEYADLSRSTLVYIEAGVYPSISDRQNGALAEVCYSRGIDARAELLEHYGESTLDEAYSSWQSAQRRAKAAELKIEPRWSTRGAFTVYVEEAGGTVDRFCKMLKVPPMSVKRYMSGETLTMPESVEEALKDIRYPWLRRLQEYQDRWLELVGKEE